MHSWGRQSLHTGKAKALYRDSSIWDNMGPDAKKKVTGPLMCSRCSLEETPIHKNPRTPQIPFCTLGLVHDGGAVRVIACIHHKPK